MPENRGEALLLAPRRSAAGDAGQRQGRNEHPGHKTGSPDTAWLAQLDAHGLLRASFVPPEPIREPRDLTGPLASAIWDARDEFLDRKTKWLVNSGASAHSDAGECRCKPR